MKTKSEKVIEEVPKMPETIVDNRMTEEEKTAFFTHVKDDVRRTLFGVGTKVMEYAASKGQGQNANMISYMLKQWRKILSQYADDNRPPRPRTEEKKSL